MARVGILVWWEKQLSAVAQMVPKGLGASDGWRSAHFGSRHGWRGLCLAGPESGTAWAG